jgi:hypothetical protein
MLMIGNDYDFSNISRLWKFEWVKDIFKCARYTAEGQQTRAKIEISKNNSRYLIKGVYKRHQDHSNVTATTFKSDSFRCSIHSSTESYDNSKSTVVDE